MHFNPGKWLRELFPQQTKNIPTIIVWTVIYILDVCLVFWLASVMGIEILHVRYQFQTVLVGLYMIVAFGLFWLEASVWNLIHS